MVAVLFGLAGIVLLLLAATHLLGFAGKRRPDGSTLNGKLLRAALWLLAAGAIVSWLLGKPGK